MFRAATSCGVSQLVRKLTRDPRRLIYTDSYLVLTSVHATQEEELSLMAIKKDDLAVAAHQFALQGQQVQPHYQGL